MTSRLAQMQARFQQKQFEEKEKKLLRLYENQQQKAFERVNRGSAGSTTSLGSSSGGGKVRQMFDERRQKAGVDKSYPLEPLKNQTRGGSVDRLNRTTIKTTRTVTQLKNGKATKRDVVKSIYNNTDGDENYEEKIVAMMNKQNLNDSLNNEVIFDEEEIFSRKLANVGGKLPSENIANVGKRNFATSNNGLGRTFRKETKPIVRKTIQHIPAQPKNATPTQSSDSLKMSRAPVDKKPSLKQSPSKQGPARDDLKECRFCGRKFCEERLETHEKICDRTMRKKRKTYDATKHRIEGTELARYARVGKNKKQPPKQPLQKDWRTTHEEFIATIRAAKETQAHLARGGKLSDLPPPRPSSNPDYIQCPHCQRRFNEAAAERHIPKCSTFQHNKSKGPAKISSTRGFK